MMARPAARPNSQRYTAGSCTLEVEVQPSALSQWSAKPIAKELSFQLWLNDAVSGAEETSKAGEIVNLEGADANESRRLIAEGDRKDLQALSQYFQQQTQRVLAISTINSRSRSAATSSPPKSLRITDSLGYLQLCDVTSVLGQYEQLTRTLPVALDAALSAETAPSASRIAAPENSLANSNVIPLATARRQRPLSTDGRQAHRRRRTSVWASSAAAALFAVGLTTTLLSRDPALQESNVASDAVPEAQKEGAILEESLPQAAAPPASRNATENSDAATATENSDTAIRESDGSNERIAANSQAGRNETGRTSQSERDRSQRDRSISQPATPRQPTASDTLPNAREETTAGSSRPQATATNPTRQPAGRLPVTEGETNATNIPNEQPPEAPTDTSSAETSSAETSNAEREPVGTTQQASPPPAVLASPAPAERTTADQPEELQREAASPVLRPAVEPESIELPAGQSTEQTAESGSEADDNDGFGRQSPETRPEARIERAAPEPFSPPPSPQAPRSTTGGGASSGIFIPPGATQDELAGASASDVDLSINQVQAYFQQRWNNRESLPLKYRLQLNAAGAVVSFIGLDEASQTERDRILPTDSSPTFGASPNSENSRVFRVQLMPDGTVIVTPF